MGPLARSNPDRGATLTGYPQRDSRSRIICLIRSPLFTLALGVILA